VHTPPVNEAVRKRIGAVTAAVFAAGLLYAVTGSAAAAPAPTLSQAQHKLSRLETSLQQLDQQYDQVQEQLAATDQRLKLVDKQLSQFSAQFQGDRAAIERIAVTAYEDGNVTSTVELLTAGNPQQILDQSSILAELSDSDNAQISQFLAAARQLTETQQLVQRTRAGVQELSASLKKRLAAMHALAAQAQSLVSQLTPVQQMQVGPGGSSSPAPPKYTGPTKTEAEKAVKFAYDQLNCPYVYGGTGPCADGFDCSGLTQAAWAYAGVAIERTSEDQWDSLPHVAEADLEPGDIMVFNDAGHVGIYVGNNELIDAPHTGADVELVAFSGWYQETYDGAVRP
jgi:peptidoglycan DL-endopeptidase CwlO